MTTVTTQTRPATVDQAEGIIRSWPDLLHSQIQTTEQAEMISEQVKRLKVPASRQWIAGRVATLLSQYFTSLVPDEMMQAIAADWNEELQAYPSWALQKACRWWMGERNPDRRKKPLPGDIAARAKHEMGAVSVARVAVSRFECGRAPIVATGVGEPCSPERAAEIVKQAGFPIKRFGGA